MAKKNIGATKTHVISIAAMVGWKLETVKSFAFTLLVQEPDLQQHPWTAMVIKINSGKTWIE